MLLWNNFALLIWWWLLVRARIICQSRLGATGLRECWDGLVFNDYASWINSSIVIVFLIVNSVQLWLFKWIMRFDWEIDSFQRSFLYIISITSIYRFNSHYNVAPLEVWMTYSGKKFTWVDVPVFVGSLRMDNLTITSSN